MTGPSTGCCARDNKFSDSIKHMDFVGCVDKVQFLKRVLYLVGILRDSVCTICKAHQSRFDYTMAKEQSCCCVVLY